MFIELHDHGGTPRVVNVRNVTEVISFDDGRFCIVRFVSGERSGIEVDESYSEVLGLLASADVVVRSGSNEGMDEPDVPDYNEWSDELKQTYKDLLSKLNLSEN